MVIRFPKNALSGICNSLPVSTLHVHTLPVIKQLKSFIVILMLVMAVGSVSGTTYTSTATGGNWSSTSTWQSGVVPVSAAGNIVIISTGATVTLSANTTYIGALTVNAGGTLNLSAYTLGTLGSLTMYCGSTATSSITGSKAISLGGNSSIISSGTGSFGAIIAPPITLTKSVSFTVADDGTSATDLTISGIISGAFGITKAGSGTMLLSGANTYTGLTTISAGTLQLGNTAALGSGAGGTTVSNGAVLDLNGITLSTPDALALNGTGISSGGALINSSATASTYTGTVALVTASSISTTGDITISGAMSGNLALTKVGAGTLTISGTNSSTSTINVSAGTLKLGSVTALGTIAGNTIVASGAVLDLNGINYSTTEPLTINGTGISGSGAVINSSSTGATFAGLITLGSPSSIIGGTGTINISNPGIITGATYGLTLGGTQGGTLSSILGTTSGTLTKQDAGTWTLSGANTYTGSTTISAGTLQLGNATALGTTAGNTTIASGAVLDLNGINYSTAEPLIINGTGISGGGTVINSSSTGATFAGLITLGSPSSIIGGTGTINISNPGTITGATYGLTLGGTQGGTLSSILGTTSGTLTKQDAGTWTLSGANTYTGSTTISAGTLQLGNATALGTTAGNTTVASGAVLDLNGINYSTAEPLIINGTGISGGGAVINSSSAGATFSGLITLASPSSIIGETGTINISNPGTITGTTYGLTLGGTQGGTLSSILGTTSGTLTKQDAGTWTLSGANTYTGATTINAGTLKLGNAAALGDTSGNTTVASGAVLDLNGQSIGTEELEIQGSLTNSNSTAASFTGDINATLADAGLYSCDGSGNIALSGNVRGRLTKVGTNTLTLNGTSDNVGLGVTANTGTIILAKTSSTNPNVHAIGGGGLTISGGTVQLGGSGGDQIYDGCTVTVNSGTFDLNAQNESIDGLSGTGGTILNNGGNASTLTFGIGNSANTYSGVIANGSGGLSIVKAGTGTYTLSGTNTYNGSTSVTGGILKAGSTQSFGLNSAVTLSNTASVGLDITGFNTTIGSLTGGGTTGGNVTLGAATLTIGSDNTSPAAYAGIISGTGAIIKSGTGTLILSGMNTYTGATTISAGKLKLGISSAVSTSGPLGATGAGATSVTSGAVLDLNGFSLTSGAAEPLTLNGTGMTNGGALINSSGTAANFGGAITLGSAGSINTTGNITLAGGITGNYNLTKIGAGVLSLGTNTSSLGGIIISAGTLTSTSGMLNLTGDFTNSATFTNNNGTVTFNGAGAQAINSGGSSFNNLALAGSGTKTFSAATTINNNLSIASGATANLGSITTHTAGTLSLAGVGEPGGTWGGSGGTSGATFTSPYFAATSGYLTVSSGTCTSGSWTGLISTDWNNPNNWCDRTVPTASTNVIINSGGNQPVIGATAVCNSLTVNTGATLTVTGSNTLTVSSDWTNNGTFTSGSGTVIMNGAAQTISGTASTTFNNLSLTGISSVTTGANITIAGNFNIGDGTTFTTGAYNLTVTGTTTVGAGTSGILSITSTTGSKTFSGAVTINNGGIMSENVAEDLSFGSDVTINGTLTENGGAAIGIAGSFVNNGTYNASTGLHTFSGAGKIISGSTVISIGNVAVTGTYTNNGTLTAGTTLSGSGTLTNAGALNVGGSCSITKLANTGTASVSGAGNITTVLANFTNTGTLNLNGSGAIAGITNNAAGIVNLANSGTISSFNNATSTSTLNISDLTVPTISTLTVSTAGNTVNYNGAGNQTVKDISYSNITFSGSGTKTYTVASAETANILTVASGVTLMLNGNNSLTPASAVINGAVTVQNTASLVKGSGTISFTSGSYFNDAIDGGVIPTATWDVNSTCNITGYVSQAGGNTSTGPSAFQTSLHQVFGNFTWNSVNQTYNATDGWYSFYAQLSTIMGNFTIASTGAGYITLGNVGTGDLYVGGNFIQTGGNFILSATGTRTMTVDGDFSITGGRFDLSSSTSSANYTTVNVGGNFSFTGGTITESGSTTNSIFNFNGTTGTQTFTSGGTLSNAVNFAILSGASVDFGTSIISSGSTGGFTLYPGGTLTTANTAGITTSGATGSIQLTGTRTYNAGANYEYDGTVAQVTGNGLTNPAASVTISNGAGVTFSAATTMNYLTITNGAKANLGTFGHTASALSLNGDGYSTGTWGGTNTAQNINTTYFAATSGIVTLTNSAGQAFSTSTTVIIPCGVTSITVEAWGGGGAGSSLNTGTLGAGGGGGAYSKGIVTVTPGNSYTINVGQGGSNGSAGGDSWFSTAATIMAKGGSGVALNSNTGATGGQASAGVGTTKFSGGTGAVGTGSGTTGYSGGGGSSAGTSANGSNGIANLNTGGTAPAGGGNGGSGGAFATPSGVVGSTPGGGGGGAYRNGSGTFAGGNGGNGQVIITYINVIPTITLGSNPTVCQGSTTANLPYSATSGCPDKYSIVYNAAALAAGFVNVSNATLPSTPIVLSVPAGAAAGTYQGNLSLVNSSTGSPSAKYPISITLNATASITSIATTTCSSTAFTVTPVNITNGAVPSGTTYSWSAPAVTGGMTGGASGSGATRISGTLTNPTNTAQTATYTVIPLSGTCSGNAFTVTVTVNPTPALTAMTSTACSGGAFSVTPVNTTNGVVPAGTTYSWTAPVVTGGMTGGTSGSGASGINGTLTNPTNTVQTATYTVTPLSGSCSGSSTFTLTVTVYPTPAITAMTISAVSGGTFTITPVNGTNGLVPSGTTYSWSAPSGTGFTGGTASSSTPTSITGTLTLTGSSATATYTVTPTYVSCSGNSFTVTVTITPNLWLGTSLSTDWAVGTNWAAGTPPVDGADVIFANTPNNDLVLDGDRTIGNLTNTSSKRLFIPAGKSLTINGTINTNNDPARIYVQSSSTLANGSLIFTTNSPVYGTVEMYSKAFCNSPSTKTDFKWQYFGIPVSSMIATPTFDGSYVRSWDETAPQATHWIQLNNLSPLSPFIGYEITQLAARTIVFSGQLVNWDSPVENLSYTPIVGSEIRFPGQNIYANPYTAAVDISQLQFGSPDKAIIDNTIYLYSTGSFNEWTGVGGAIITAGDNAVYGQYTAIPINLAHAGLGLPSQVPSMQAMMIWSHQVNPAATFTIPYSAVVKNTAQQRSPGNKTDSLPGDKIGTIVEVTGAKCSDKMWLFSQPGCTRTFDNGWDGVKIPGTAMIPQIYAMEPDGNYQVDALEDVNNTLLGFQAGVDTEYKLTFTHQNLASKYAGMFLVDMVENKTIDVTESGSTYSFSAESTPTPVKRFMIVTRSNDKEASDGNTRLKVFSSGNTVFVQNLSNLNGEMIVYDMMGHSLKRAIFEPYGVTAVQVSAITEAYIVKASTSSEKVSKKIIIEQ